MQDIANLTLFRPFAEAAPSQGAFVFKEGTIMPGNLTAPILIKLTIEDAEILKKLAVEAECTPGQLARYAVRVFIHRKLKDKNAEA